MFDKFDQEIFIGDIVINNDLDFGIVENICLEDPIPVGAIRIAVPFVPYIDVKTRNSENTTDTFHHLFFSTDNDLYKCDSLIKISKDLLDCAMVWRLSS